MDSKGLENHFDDSAVELSNLHGLHSGEHLAEELEEEFGRSDITILVTKDPEPHFRFFRYPRLRQQWADCEHTILIREARERRATPLELFYDLVFVASIGVLSHTLRSSATFSAAFFVQYLALFLLWLETTYFIDKFAVDDGFFRLLVLLCMCGIVGMGIEGEPQRVAVDSGYPIAFIAARTAVELMYSTAWLLPKVRRFLALHLAVYLITVAFFIGSIFPTSSSVALGLQVCGFGVGFVGFFLSNLLPWRFHLSIPINPEHVSERLNIFVVIILGETIISSVFEEEGLYSAQMWGGAMMGVVLSMCLAWLFFDVENGKHGLPLKHHALRRHPLWGTLWILSIIPFQLAVLLMSAGIYNAINFYFLTASALEQVGRAASTLVRSSVVSNVTDMCVNVTGRVAEEAATNHSASSGMQPTLEELCACYFPAVSPHRNSEAAAGGAEELLRVLCTDHFYYGRWIMMVGAGACLFWLTVNGLAHKREDETKNHYLSHWPRALISGGFALTLFLVPLAGDRLSPLQYMGIATALVGLSVFVGLENKHSAQKLVKRIESLPALSRSASSAKFSNLSSEHKALLHDAGLSQRDLVDVVQGPSCTGGAAAAAAKFY